jgi:hypothetical protein
MLETLCVLATVAGVLAVGFVTTLVSPGVMAEVGLWTLAVGLVAGLPTGLWYHVALYRLLSTKSPLPSGWWWSPVDYHAHLTPPELARIRPWFLVGGIGFLLSLIGGLAAMAGFILSG